MSLDRLSSSQQFLGFCDADALLLNRIMAGKVRIPENHAHTDYIQYVSVEWHCNNNKKRKVSHL